MLLDNYSLDYLETYVMMTFKMSIRTTVIVILHLKVLE